MICHVHDLGLVDYLEACDKQKQAFSKVLETHHNFLFFCEHPPTFTIGRMDKKNNFLLPIDQIKKKGIPVLPVDRGGEVTFHGPGQMVVYPIFDLAFLKKDLRFFMAQMEQAVIDFLREFDIVSCRLLNHTGVWIGQKKIASIGIGVRRWVSYHGFSVNVNTDLSYFSMIRPCGENIKMTSLSSCLKKKVDLKDAKKRMMGCLQKIFNILYI